jgi:hypothetical protein
MSPKNTMTSSVRPVKARRSGTERRAAETPSAAATKRDDATSWRALTPARTPTAPPGLAPLTGTAAGYGAANARRSCRQTVPARGSAPVRK